MAQRVPSPKQLTSFCGFKAGEKKQSIKVSKGNDIYPETVRCRTPFRKFRDARLNFSDDDRLESVCAVTFIQGMKPNGGKAELNKCCSELEKYGIVFPKEWKDQGEGHLEKIGSGPGVSLVHIQGNLQASRYDEKSEKELKGVLITIDLSWELTPPTMSETTKYDATNKVSRRVLVEKTFGVKFGEDIPIAIMRSRYTKKLDPPMFGLTDIVYIRPPNSPKLYGVRLDGKGPAAKNSAAVKPAFTKLCNEVRNWLGFDRYDNENQESVANLGVTCNMITSDYRDKTLEVAVEAVWSPKWKTSQFHVIISDPTAEKSKK